MVTRRWYILLVGLLLIAVAAGAAVKLVPSQYQASGQVLLLLSSDVDDKPTNPFLNTQPGLIATAGLISSSVMTKDTLNSLQAAGFSTDYAVSVNPDSGPLIVLNVNDTDPARAMATRDELIRRLSEQLATIQADENVPAPQLIHPRPINLPSQPETLAGSKLRAVAVIAAVGLILTGIFMFTLDRGLVARRRRSRKVNQPKIDIIAKTEPAVTPQPTTGRRERRRSEVSTPTTRTNNSRTADEVRPSKTIAKINGNGADHNYGDKALRLGLRAPSPVNSGRPSGSKTSRSAR